jgi:hypothetical protein
MFRAYDKFCRCVLNTLFFVDWAFKCKCVVCQMACPDHPAPMSVWRHNMADRAERLNWDCRCLAAAVRVPIAVTHPAVTMPGFGALGAIRTKATSVFSGWVGAHLFLLELEMRVDSSRRFLLQFQSVSLWQSYFHYLNTPLTTVPKNGLCRKEFVILLCCNFPLIYVGRSLEPSYWLRASAEFWNGISLILNWSV